MVVDRPQHAGTAAEDGRLDVRRMVSDLERLRGPLRIAVRFTPDGLGVHIPPQRQILPLAFMSVWLTGWAVGEWFAIGEVVRGGPGLFLIVWLIPWTVGGAGVIWVILWQTFGVEQLYFTAGALVREWKIFGLRRRRVVHGGDIRSVVVVDRTSNDLAGLGTIEVTTSGRPLRIGSGLSAWEGELVATLIDDARRDAERTEGP